MARKKSDAGVGSRAGSTGAESKFEYIQMKGGATTQEVLDLMSRMGLRSANYDELCLHDLKHPHEKERYPIVACLNSFPQSIGNFYNLCRSDGSVGCPVGTWDGECRFLAFKKTIRRSVSGTPPS